MKGPVMTDLLFVAMTIAFFVLCVGYVRVCDRIIGPDPRLPGDPEPHAESETRPEIRTVEQVGA
jgi:hypothetical protein